MAQMLVGPATGRSGRVLELGKIEVRNRALKPRRVIPVGPPTTQFGARPGRGDGVEWLHQPTSEHVFGPLPGERARRPAAPLPWAILAAAAVGVLALVAGLALAA